MLYLFCFILGFLVGIHINRNFSYRKYLRSKAWRALRKQVLIRDGYRCQKCGSNENLQVHHRTYDNIGREKPEDLVTLCRKHHEQLENAIKKKRALN